MKFYIVNDNNALYRIMYNDVLNGNASDVTEVPIFKEMPPLLRAIRGVHLNSKLSNHFDLPLKDIWKPYYTLDTLRYDRNENYWIVILNGTLRQHYSSEYFDKLKTLHPNVKLALVMYDSVSNPYAARAVSMTNSFDVVFSFDPEDCQKYGFTRFYSTLSYPRFVSKDESLKSSIFFVGSALGREAPLRDSMEYLISNHVVTSFFVTGVRDSAFKVSGVCYNHPIRYEEALERTYNSESILEIVKPGQTGITLRTCEAIILNKRLLTNNKTLLQMPFYDPRYMKVFDTLDETDLEFLAEEETPSYSYENEFSPLRIFEQLKDMDVEC